MSEHTCAPDGEGKCARNGEVRFGNLDYDKVHMMKTRALTWAEVGGGLGLAERDVNPAQPLKLNGDTKARTGELFNSLFF